jgi:hypothetical protein
VAPVPPALTAVQAEPILGAADAAREAAFAATDSAPLRQLFTEAALRPMILQLNRLKARGQSVEERVSGRRLVHWAGAAGRGEGVLEVVGEERLNRLGTPERSWSRIVRQWRAVVVYSGGRWVVAEAADLPPSQWWPG